jgi:hypothetical protein
MEHLNKITDFDKYKGLTSDNKKLTADFRPLNFDALLKAGAVRVTNRGLDNGKYDPDTKSGFSLVSGYNDAVGEGTRQWPANPEAYGVVRDMFMTRPEDIQAHKYLQILQSARDLGLKDSDIYAPTEKTITVNPAYSDPFSDTTK